MPVPIFTIIVSVDPDSTSYVKGSQRFFLVFSLKIYSGDDDFILFCNNKLLNLVCRSYVVIGHFWTALNSLEHLCAARKIFIFAIYNALRYSWLTFQLFKLYIVVGIAITYYKIWYVFPYEPFNLMCLNIVFLILLNWSEIFYNSSLFI